MECCICLNDEFVYLSLLKDCRHEFCTNCLKNIQQNNRENGDKGDKIRCPLCREESTVIWIPKLTKEQITQFATNPKALYFKDEYVKHFDTIFNIWKTTFQVAIYEQQRFYNNDEMKLIKQFVIPKFTELRQLAFNTCITMNLVNKHIRWLFEPYPQSRRKIEIDSLSKLFKKARDTARQRRELLIHLLNGHPIHFNGFDQEKSFVELEDGTIMNAIQYTLYESDNPRQLAKQLQIEDVLDKMIEYMHAGFKDLQSLYFEDKKRQAALHEKRWQNIMEIVNVIKLQKFYLISSLRNYMFEMETKEFNESILELDALIKQKADHYSFSLAIEMDYIYHI